MSELVIRQACVEDIEALCALILEHGPNNYSLYGYLSDIAVERGATVEAGAELGRTGSAPAGPPALYFEMRIDGRSVDPLQWLKAR